MKMMWLITILSICIAFTSAFQFVEYEDDTSNPKFKFDKNFGDGNETFTKMTTRFHLDENNIDGTWFATYWTPGKEARIQPKNINALIFVVHGYSEYLSNNYDEIAKHWSQQVGGGALVFGHDHAGHGRTTFGKRALATDMKDFTAPIIAHVREIQKLTKRNDKNLPVFVAAQAFGGLISLATILEEPKLFQGLIGIGPLVKLNPEATPKIMVFLAELISKFWPSFGLIAGIDVKDVTRDESHWNSMETDPLIYHGRIQAGTVWFLMKETKYLQEHLEKIELPILVLQGENDPLLDPEGAKMLYVRASSKDKEYKEYPGAFHLLLLELPKVREDVKKRSTEWLNNRCEA